MTRRTRSTSSWRSFADELTVLSRGNQLVLRRSIIKRMYTVPSAVSA